MRYEAVVKKILQDYTYSQVESLVSDLGAERFRARQIWDAMNQGKALSKCNIPASLKESILAEYEDEPVSISETLTDGDSEKYLFALSDGNRIEGVSMLYKYGRTQCVSTQVGCRMGCAFCASTKGGLVRNLSSGEILAEVQKVNALKKDGAGRGVTNIVLMGSGEPLDNYDNVVSFLRAVTAEDGLNISARNITLSTCGLAPEMRRLAKEGIPVSLTVSLHAPTDEQRSRIMPIAKRYSISEILNTCSRYFDSTGRRYCFEYSLIDGVNSDREDARALARLLKGRPCHVNLIRLNAVAESAFRPASKEKTKEFLKILTDSGISATVRREMGAEIGGACGQLRASRMENKDKK